MIIIKIDKERTVHCNMAIAAVMFNMELGKNVFNLDGTLITDGGDYHVLSKDGITYTIQGITGNVVILANDVDKRYNEFLGWDLEKALHTLDDVYIDVHNDIKIYTSKSLDYTLELKAIKSKQNKKERRKITLKDSLPNGDVFTWKMGVTDILFHDVKKAYDRNVWEYQMLQRYNTIIIDTDNVFNTEKNITMLNREPEMSDYTMSSRFISMDPISFSKTSGILYEIKNAFGIENNVSDFNNIEPVFIPIYEEKWESIRPRRVVVNNETMDIKITIMSKHFNDCYEYMLAELEEVKNVEAGAPPKPNDVCSLCYMYLHDDIYALEPEKQHCHICVCANCFHEHLHPHHMHKSAFKNATVLKVTYPRTIIDIIDHKDNTMKDDVKNLMRELCGEYEVFDGGVRTENFIGYYYIKEVMLKQVTPPKDKKLFICKLYD